MLSLLLSALACHVVQAEVTLQHLDTAYMPYAQDPETFGYDQGATEKGAIDENGYFIYTVGGNLVQVVGFDNPSSLTRPYYTTLPGPIAATDVTSCGTWVAVSAVNDDDPRLGKVIVYSAYTAGGSMTLLHDITVGTKPDMLIFTSDCTKILVAIEASVANDLAGEPFDDEGEIVTIIFDTTPDGIYAIQRSNFMAFNPLADDYLSRGVRWVYRGEGSSFINTFSQAMEPEYITFNDDESMAYIVLQDNNAIASLNMSDRQIVDIYPLGEKLWLNYQLDPSDQDSGIEISPWEVYGMYLPDGFTHASYNGQGYLITANEGNIIEHGAPIDWIEAQRGMDFYLNDQIADTVSIGLRDSLGDDSQLGRLDLSLVDHQVPGEDKYDKFSTYGGRSFSLFRVESDGSVGALHYDSGSELEQQIALLYPDVFNANSNDGSEEPEASFDTRSDRSGPEPESVVTGEINGKHLIFVGIERPGFIGVYSVDPQNDVPQFESLHFYGGTGDTYENLYNAGVARDLDPEGLRFIPSSESPIGAPILAVFAPVTSTVSLYQVVDLP